MTTAADLLARTNWHEERKALAAIMRDTGLEEAVKWNQLCYALPDGGNVAIIYVFDASCGVSFFKGKLLDDPEGRLSDNGPNTRSVMRMDFTSLEEIEADEGLLRAFVKEAAANEAAGRKAIKASAKLPDAPAELAEAFDDDDSLKAAWEALTPGRRRGWLIHFNDAKQAETRRRRIDKARPRILAGKGMHDL